MYQINGTVICPTTGRWIERAALGINGHGQSVYSGIQQFELVWDFISVDDFNAFLSHYESQTLSGSVVATLPNFRAASYLFVDYPGTIMNEPTADEYFAEHLSNVTVILSVKI